MYRQDNIHELFELINQIPGQQYAQTKYYDYINTTNSAWPNQLLNLKANRNNLNQVLKEIENRSENSTLPNLLMCDPTNDNPNIISQIKSRNYRSGAWEAMTHYLVSFKSQSLVLDPDLEIKLIRDSTDLQLWIDIVESELMGDLKLNADIFNSLLKENSCFFFLGIRANKPVATSFLFNGKENGGIYLVSTIKTQRKKGIGKQMTYNCIEKAKELNCKKVDIQATDLGKPVYESLGFESHGKINVFRIEKTIKQENNSFI